MIIHHFLFYVIIFNMIKHNKNVGIILLLIIIINIILGLIILNKKMQPIVIEVARDECKNIVTLISNDVVKSELESNTYNNLFINDTDIDTIIINRLQTNIVNKIIYNLECIEKGNIYNLDLYNKNILANRDKLDKGIIYEVPLTINYNNIIFSNLSPKIPIKFNLIGNVESNINSNVKEYGINSAIIEIVLNIKINLKVVIPFIKENYVVNTSIPLVTKIVKGDIPNYYSIGNNSNLSIPIK